METLDPRAPLAQIVQTYLQKHHSHILFVAPYCASIDKTTQYGTLDLARVGVVKALELDALPRKTVVLLEFNLLAFRMMGNKVEQDTHLIIANSILERIPYKVCYLSNIYQQLLSAELALWRCYVAPCQDLRAVAERV